MLPHDPTGFRPDFAATIDHVVIDLDRTLLRDDFLVSDASVSALRKCRSRNRTIIFATARTFGMARAALPAEFADCCWICSNGSEVYDAARLLRRNRIGAETCGQVMRTFDRHFPDVPYLVFFEQGAVANRGIDGFLKENFPRLDLPYSVGFGEPDYSSPAEKIVFDPSGIPDLTSLADRLPSACRMSIAMGIVGEIFHRDATKLGALQFLLQELSGSLDRTIAFGDDLSDVDLIRSAGIGVAMGNAVAQVRAEADLIAPSNNDDGVAYILNMLA